MSAGGSGRGVKGELKTVFRRAELGVGAMFHRQESTCRMVGDCFKQ